MPSSSPPAAALIYEIGLCFSLLKARLWVNNRGVLRPYLQPSCLYQATSRMKHLRAAPAGQVGKRQLLSVFAAIEAGCIAYPP